MQGKTGAVRRGTQIIPVVAKGVENRVLGGSFVRFPANVGGAASREADIARLLLPEG